ncbi:MAG: response regulator [Gemmatimonadetes bacterium]|nr:response regulator [Gemmatimonadota bacterium]
MRIGGSRSRRIPWTPTTAGSRSCFPSSVPTWTRCRPAAGPPGGAACSPSTRGCDMRPITPDVDLSLAIGAACVRLARAVGRGDVMAVLFRGDPPEGEVLGARPPSVAARPPLRAGAASALAAMLRSSTEPIRVPCDELPGGGAMAARLDPQEASALALVPLLGEAGLVGCMLAPLAGDASAGRLQSAWLVASRAPAALQLAAGTAALRVILNEDRRRPLGLCDGVVVLDRRGRVLLADGVAQELEGWGPLGTFGRPLASLPGGEALVSVRTSKPGEAAWEEGLACTAQGGPLPLLLSALPGRLLAGQLDGSKVLLLKDRREGSATVDRTARILSLGLRVAHLADELLGMGASPGLEDAGASGLIEALAGEAEGALSLVRDVLERTAGEAPTGEVHLNECLGQVLAHLQRWVDARRVRVFSFLRPELRRVPGDSVEILRALGTLARRAQDSMRPNGGTLTVRSWEEDHWVCAAISDDGSGTSASPGAPSPEALFPGAPAPTAPGLDDVRAIVERHGGRLLVEQRPSVWNRYTLMLPLERRSGWPRPAPLPSRRPEGPSGRALEVLVVDDNAALRSVLRRFLERRGHVVTEACDGEEALEIVMARSFDRAIVDIHMPRKNGPGFYTSLAEVAPHMQARTLFTTGGNLDAAEERFLELAGRPSIPKPFDLKALAGSVEGAA